MDIKLLLPLLPFFFHPSESGCPSVCSCTNTSVLCMEKDLDKIPNFETLENDPLIIDLSGNKIDVIGPNDLSFEKTYSVKEVYLNNSELFDIDYEAFDEMENLQELYLSENLLNSIPDNLIEDLPNMVLLDLSHNYFSGDMPVIKSQSLEMLVLANCKITSIPLDSLKHLPNLRILLLQQNNIKYIEPKVFESVLNMFFVRLSYNSWECNCHTMELFDFLAKKKLVDTSEPYQCSHAGGDFLDIYGKQGIEVYRNLCVKRAQPAKLKSQRKRYRYLTKQEYLLLESNNSPPTEVDEFTPVESEPEIVHDRSYSLVRENGARKRDSDDEAIVPEFLRESTMAPIESYYSVESERSKGPVENIIEIKGCESPKYLIPEIRLRLDQFLFIITSFAIGLAVGFTSNQFLNSARYKKLETSDSTTKLKIDFH